VSPLEVVVAIVIALGVIGIVVPFMPGEVLVVAAILVWASETTGLTAWTVAAVAVALVGAGAVVKYVVPGRRMRAAGIPTSTLLAGAATGIVGFFVIPVVGLLIGFVLGIYLAELRRLGAGAARPATLHALKAVGLGLLIELCAAVLAAGTWAVGVVLT
jgi:uncharacterized protein